MLGSARTTSSYLEGLKYFISNSTINNIPRQSVYNWIKSWNIPVIKPEVLPSPKTLYVMADEKYIGSQDTVNDIMVKCFVTFEGIQQLSKGRKELINRRIFSCNEKNAWPKFMDYIASIYDFTKIDNIVLLGDGANWIKTGISELKLAPNNNVSFRLCEFHFKQAINRITTDKDERKSLTTTFTTKGKTEFKNEVEELLEKYNHRKDKITKNLNYILNNYSNIKSMINSDIGSSMESHISHFIANTFSSRPKGFSNKTINHYLKLNDLKHNNYNIFDIYINNKTGKIVQNKSNNINKKLKVSNIKKPDITVLTAGKRNWLYEIIHKIVN